MIVTTHGRDARRFGVVAVVDVRCIAPPPGAKTTAARMRRWMVHVEFDRHIAEQLQMAERIGRKVQP